MSSPTPPLDATRGLDLARLFPAVRSPDWKYRDLVPFRPLLPGDLDVGPILTVVEDTPQMYLPVMKSAVNQSLDELLERAVANLARLDFSFRPFSDRAPGLYVVEGTYAAEAAFLRKEVQDHIHDLVGPCALIAAPKEGHALFCSMDDMALARGLAGLSEKFYSEAQGPPMVEHPILMINGAVEGFMRLDAAETSPQAPEASVAEDEAPIVKTWRRPWWRFW